MNTNGTLNTVQENEAQALDNLIASESLDTVIRSYNSHNLKNIMVPVAMIAVMWSEIDHALLLGWGILIIVGIGAMSAVVVRYMGQDVPVADTRKWSRRFSAIMLYLSVLWGSTAFLFYVEGSAAHQVFLFTLLTTISMSAVLAGLHWLPLYYMRAWPIMGALITRLFMSEGLANTLLAILLLLGFLSTMRVAKSMNASVRSERYLRHKSNALTEALHIKTEEAEQATLAKSGFLAAACHDLRQPLHALSLFVHVLKETKQEDERASVISRIDYSLDILRKLFDALLDMSRLDAKIVTVGVSHFVIADLLKTLADEFRPVASNKGIELRLHACSVVIASDRLLLERVLRNLIANAIRYTEAGGVLLTARLRGDCVLVQVWDTGIGIEAEYLDEVFVEFQQLDKTHRDRKQGLGLGLAIVKRLCRLLNHPLDLASRPGRGTAFSVSIPQGSASQIRSAVSSSVLHSWDLTGRRLLVIDDEHEILDAMRALLGKWGCEVIAAESLEDALQQLNDACVVPELILSDLHLSNDNTGIQAIAHLRKKYGESIQALLITGDTAPEQIRIAKDSGFELLFKPVQPARLRGVIQTMMVH